MSPSLRSLQDDLLALLLADPALAPDASRVAAGSARLTPDEQVAIYREQIRERHRTSLRHDFALLAALLGPRLFDALADGYLLLHPPAAFSLRDLGARLPASVPPLLTAAGLPGPDVALAADVARLEWTMVEASDAPDGPVLDRAALASLSPEQLDAAVLVFAPSLSLLSLAHPVHRLNDALDRGDPLPAISPSPTCLAVSRRPDDHTLAVVPLAPLEHAALARLLPGEPLACALDAVAAAIEPPDSIEQLAASVGPWFASWVERGWLREVRLAPA